MRITTRTRVHATRIDQLSSDVRSSIAPSTKHGSLAAVQTNLCFKTAHNPLAPEFKGRARPSAEGRSPVSELPRRL